MAKFNFIPLDYFNLQFLTEGGGRLFGNSVIEYDINFHCQSEQIHKV